MGDAVIRFGGFVLDRGRGRLEDAAGGERVLRPKSYRVLELLAERRGMLVSKDELVRHVWPDVFVSDDSLAQCVSDIRRVMGPDGAGLLQTVPRRGYRLMLKAEPEAGASAEPVARTPRRARGLAAVALVAAAVGVSAWWLVPRSGRVAVEAPSAPVSVGDAEPATAPLAEAQALLEARDWRRRQDNARARALLERVVEAEPGNSDAWASLGLTYWLEVQHLAWGGGRREMTTALEMVERAVALDASARSHRLLAEMRLLAPFPEMRSAIDALASARAAVALAPDDPDNLAVLSEVFALTGRAEEAVAEIEAARRLDPTPPDWYRRVAGLSYLLAGAPARAAEEFGPLYGAGTFANSRWWPGWLLAASLAHAGRLDEAAAVVAAARARRPETTVAGVAQSFNGFADAAGLELVLDGLRLAGMPG